MQKTGFVAVVGRPSAGKSTLVNRMCGHKVSITSTVPQTTRNSIRGIFNHERGQLVFVDTPGFHRSERKFNLHMREIVANALEDVDAVLYVVDASRRPGEEEAELAGELARQPVPVVCALNKVDLLAGEASPHADFLKRARQAHEARDDFILLRISAVTGEGVEELASRLFDVVPEGEPFYPGDLYTDQEPRFRIAEIIREKAILESREELPHALYVDIADAEFRDPEDPESPLWVRAFVYVERENQKAILVGRGGSKVKRIRTSAEAELAEIFPYPVKLDLRVKVHKKWRQKDVLLRRLLT